MVKSGRNGEGEPGQTAADLVALFEDFRLFTQAEGDNR